MVILYLLHNPTSNLLIRGYHRAGKKNSLEHGLEEGGQYFRSIPFKHRKDIIVTIPTCTIASTDPHIQLINVVNFGAGN